MILHGLRLPPGGEVLCADGRGGTGNITLVYRDGAAPRVLKIYRTRRSALSEALGGLSHRFIEGKRGASAAARCATERLAIAAWADAGCAVVGRLDLPPPAELSAPSNWLEYVAAPTLQAVLAGTASDAADPAELLRRLGADCAQRHRRALARQEPLLVHERALAGHVFVAGDRLVWFDLENGFRPDYPLPRALARELAGLARSLLRIAPAPATGDGWLRAFVAGYADRALLDELVKAGAAGLPLARQRARVALLQQLAR